MLKSFPPRFDNQRIIKTRHASQINEPKSWGRSDAIAVGAAFVAALSLVLSVMTELRARHADQRAIEAVAVGIGAKVRKVANDASTSATFIQGFLDHGSKVPNDVTRMDQYTVEFMQRLEFPDLSVPPEHLIALAHADSDAAGKLAACIARLADVQSDQKIFTGLKPGTMDQEHRRIASVIPYRLRQTHEACKASIEALIALDPQLPEIMGPIRGTIGEWIEALKSGEEEKAAGTSMNIEVRGNQVTAKETRTLKVGESASSAASRN